MSHPLILNIKKYLNGASSELLNEVVFHEILHILLTDNWKVWPTNLIKKYSGANQTVATHLHLMSIERAVHLSMQNYDQLNTVERWYLEIGNGYDIAWKTISANDLYQEFILELKDNSQWTLRV